MMDTAKILQNLRHELPAVVARSEIKKRLGGMVSVGHMANLDSAGLGPPRVRLGRRVGYPRDALLDWLRERMQDVEGTPACE